MDRENLWAEYWDMVYDSASVPESDCEELEQKFYADLDSGNIQGMINNLENIRHECGVLMDWIQEYVEKGDRG